MQAIDSNLPVTRGSEAFNVLRDQDWQLSIRLVDTEVGGQCVTGQTVEAIVIIGGVGLLTHQLRQLIHSRRHNRAVERPRTWQQALGVGTLTLGAMGLVLVASGYCRLQRISENLAQLAQSTGLVIFLGAISLRIWAMHSLGVAFAPDLRTSTRSPLMTSGAYAWVRHPYYLSAILLTLGAGLALLNGLVLGMTALLTLILLSRIRVEERMLIGHYGARYLSYRQRVPALLPRVLRRSSEFLQIIDSDLCEEHR